MKQRNAFIPDKVIARKAYELLSAYRKINPAYTLPYNLEELIWDYLNPLEGLNLDDETPLGHEPTTGDRILGKTVLSNRTIYINPEIKHEPYYRFTLAHEIGHWILHCRPHLPNPDQLSLFEEAPHTEESTEWITLYRSMGDFGGEQYDPLEVQANKFAAHLLMPEEDIRREFIARFQGVQKDQSGKFDSFVYGLITKRVQGGKTLQEAFGTSLEAMSYRLRGLGLVLNLMEKST
ncbi:MAG: ImmA/IrrE family metallo-endopeptidase [Candidatus Sumerlaeia bacterium]|nr:ImmA/IrrE family metallo-endopeptidase [Candidatus Sumerlaeia bacterium]